MIRNLIIILFIFSMTGLFLMSCAPKKEACQNLDESSWQSYYDPSQGTVNLNYDVNPCGVKVIGEPLNGRLFVGSNIARSLREVTNQGTKTLMQNGKSFEDLYIENNILNFVNAGFKYKYNLETNSVESKIITRAAACEHNGAVCKDNGIEVDHLYLIPAQYPRAVKRETGFIYVADTFGHKVIVFEEASRSVIKEYEIYYPNSIQILGRELIVTAEHQNAVYNINLTTETKSIIFGCGLDVYADPNATVAQIQAREQSGDLRLESGHSVCRGLLYSPNDAYLMKNGDLLIADTDNHRVIIVRNGQVVTEVTGLNNPSRAVMVEE